jgi:hypothetical protein
MHFLSADSLLPLEKSLRISRLFSILKSTLIFPRVLG